MNVWLFIGQNNLPCPTQATSVPTTLNLRVDLGWPLDLGLPLPVCSHHPSALNMSQVAKPVNGYFSGATYQALAAFVQVVLCHEQQGPMGRGLQRQQTLGLSNLGLAVGHMNLALGSAHPYPKARCLVDRGPQGMLASLGQSSPYQLPHVPMTICMGNLHCNCYLNWRLN
jgi:hypothetical protein